MDTKILESIGLTNSESKVYLSLIELGSSTRKNIIAKSGIASSKVYELLDKLIKKGLVSCIIKSNVKYFEAAPASRILEYLNEKQRTISEEISEVKRILPELELKQKLSKEKSDVSFYKSLKGIETIFSSILSTLKKGDEYYVFGAIAGGINDSQRILLSKYHQKRAEQGISLKIIFHKGVGYLEQYAKMLKNAQIHYMREELLGPAQTMIVKDKTIIILWSENPIGIVIENKAITDNYKKYFDFLWSMTK